MAAPRTAGDSRQRVRKRAWRPGKRSLVAWLVGAILIGTAATLAALASSDASPGEGARRTAPQPQGTLNMRLAGGYWFKLDLSRYVVEGRLDRSVLSAALRGRLRPTRAVRRGRARITYRVDEQETIHAALALGTSGGIVEVAARAVSANVAAPVVSQRLRNNCESAALEALLATTGVRIDQLRLQFEFGRDGPLDPKGVGNQRVWGDPDVGYVGRAGGGGVAGGFGIYPRPVADVARRHGRKFEDLTRVPIGRIMSRLRHGRAVMAWVGLSDGPYGEWRSPRGRPIRVNFGEHTVTLTGVRADGLIRVMNPLEGTRELWSRERFATMWARLGNRALGA